MKKINEWFRKNFKLIFISILAGFGLGFLTTLIWYNEYLQPISILVGAIVCFFALRNNPQISNKITDKM